MTGRYPRIAIPTEVPTMPDSASGASMTRWSPKSFCRPSVTRKTPPSLPMSSPMSTTLSSSSIAFRRPAVIAFDSGMVVVISDGLLCALEGGEVREVGIALLVDEGVGLRVHVLPHGLRRRRLHRDAGRPDAGGHLVRLRVDGGELTVCDALLLQVAAQAQDRVLRGPRLRLRIAAVLRGVVGRRVRAHPVREGLDEQGSVAGA